MTASAHSAPQAPIARFGLFDLNLGTRELLREGVRIKLQDQPFRILEYLVEQAPTIVSRDDLQCRLWADGTFVDFDHSLNTAIKKLRQALDDGADNPRFIETVPRRGYRFIAPIQWIAANDETPSSPVLTISTAVAAKLRRQRFSVLWITLATCALALLAFIAWRTAHPVAPPKASFDFTVSPLTSYPGKEDFGDLSPDGDKVAFSWDQGNGAATHIFVKQVGAEQALQLTSGNFIDVAPAWSPDGKYIAFSRATADFLFWYHLPVADLYIMSSLGGEERKLMTVHLQSKLGGYFCPRMHWSPDGKTIAYTDVAPNTNNVAVFLLSLDTLQKRQLTFPSEYVRGDKGPIFSPDGKTIAFIRSGMDAHDVFTVPVSGGAPTQITNDKGAILTSVAWTADGRSLVYAGFGIRIVPAQGGQSRLLLPASLSASLSIVGKRLAYSDYTYQENIYSATLNGSTVSSAWQKQLASTRAEEGPRFSPDGKRIAFQSTRSGNIEIWVADADGSNPIRLTDHRGPLTGSPRWSPDGQTIVYDSRAAVTLTFTPSVPPAAKADNSRTTAAMKLCLASRMTAAGSTSPRIAPGNGISGRCPRREVTPFRLPRPRASRPSNRRTAAMSTMRADLPPPAFIAARSAADRKRR